MDGVFVLVNAPVEGIHTGCLMVVKKDTWRSRGIKDREGSIMSEKTWYSTELQLDGSTERGVVYINTVTVHTCDKEFHDKIVSWVESLRENG